MGFCIEPARKAGEFTGVTDNTMARHKNRYGVSTVRCTYCPRGLGVAELFRKLAVSASFSIGDPEQRFPHLLLEICSSHVERNRETASLSRKVFVQLFLCANEYGMLDALDKLSEANPSWAVVLPEDGDKASIAGD